MPFRDIIGHRRILALLARSVAHASLPPSLIFAGPPGVGKRRTALAVAQALNCLAPRVSSELEIDACGVCAACTRIERGVHPDVLLIEPGDSGAIKIERVRDAVDRAAYRPFEGRRRAVIIDEADALVAQAQNALLKTLEEPPPASVFMLVTARPDVLLPTVRSRCPQLPFRPLPAQDIAAALVARGQNDTDAWAVAATANGSLGQALAASGGALAEAREVAQRVLVQAAGASGPRRRIESAKELLAKTGAHL
jgi:DNA polymerase-3 subunit delta'